LVRLEALPADGGLTRFKTAAEAGEAWAMAELGVRYAFLDEKSSLVKRDPAAAARWLRRAVATRNSVAPLFLAMLYCDGPTPDYDEAQRLLMQARQMKGDDVPKGLAAAASNQLAIMCLRGQGIEMNPTLALRFFRDAADQGSLSAMYEIGHMFEHGLGVTVDNETAVLWYEKASQPGYRPAQRSLARLGVIREVGPAALETKKP
jgi:TPR repeat protein